MAGTVQWSNVTPNITVNPKDTVANPFGYLGAGGAEMLKSYQQMQQMNADKVSSDTLSNALGVMSSMDPNEMTGTNLRQVMSATGNMNAADRMKLIGAFNTLQQQNITNKQNQDKLDLFKQNQDFTQNLDTKKYNLDVLNSYGSALQAQQAKTQELQDAQTEADKKKAEEQRKIDQAEADAKQIGAQFIKTTGVGMDFTSPQTTADFQQNSYNAIGKNKNLADMGITPEQWMGVGDAGSVGNSLHDQAIDALLPAIQERLGDTKLPESALRQIADNYLPTVMENLKFPAGKGPKTGMFDSTGKAMQTLLSGIKTNAGSILDKQGGMNSAEFQNQKANFLKYFPTYGEEFSSGRQRWEDAQQRQAQAADQRATADRNATMHALLGAGGILPTGSTPITTPGQPGFNYMFPKY